MPLNVSGPISLGNIIVGQSINLELGQAFNAQISLNDTNVRTLAGVASGAIIMPTNFWGKSSTVPDLAVTASATPFVVAYPFSASTGYGTRYANPGTLPTGQGIGLSFNPAGTALAVSHGVTPFVTAYPWSAGFGTKYADPVSNPSNQVNAVAFNRAGTVISCAASGSVGQASVSYPWSPGFGTRYADPASPPPNNGGGVAFNNVL